VTIAIDTNVLLYAEGLERAPADALKVEAAREMLDRLGHHGFVLPVQVLGELFSVLIRRGGLDRAAAQRVVTGWRASAVAVPPTDPETLAAALTLATTHRLPIWDAVILAAAAAAGCALLLSEDFQDGFVWHGVTVANPFAAAPHPLLADRFR